MRDVDQGRLDGGMAAARAMCAYPLQRGRMTADDVEAKLARIEPTIDPAALAGADLVIEAVTEDPYLKKRVLRELEGRVGADAIIATNTSSLPIDELAGVLERPERFVAVHFFNPVNRMPLVEIARAPATTDAVRATAIALARNLGKTPIVVGGRPGFVSNRVLFPYLLEALHLADDAGGIDDLDGLDRFAIGFGLPMGPYGLMDEIGIDVTVKIADSLERSFGDRYRCPELARGLSEAGMLGRKSGAGFYAYAGRDARPKSGRSRAAACGRTPAGRRRRPAPLLGADGQRGEPLPGGGHRQRADAAGHDHDSGHRIPAGPRRHPGPHRRPRPGSHRRAVGRVARAARRALRAVRSATPRR